RWPRDWSSDVCSSDLVAACRRLAAVIRAHSIPADHEESSLPGFGAKEIANFYLLLVAICHQTSPRDLLALEGGVGGRRLRGWDRSEERRVGKEGRHGG